MQYEKIRLLDSDLPKVVMSGPLSRETVFSLHITGPYRVAEIVKMIQMLELHKAWLVEDETPANSQPSKG